MSKKHVVRFGAAAIGLIGADAAGHWNSIAGNIQIAMYSVMTVGLLLVGFWSDRQRPGFAIAICSMLAAHCAFLFAIRGLFPFRTILTTVPVALMEGAMLAILMLKILEHSRASDDI